MESSSPLPIPPGNPGPPLQILFVTCEFPPTIGGAGHVAANLARCLPSNISVLVADKDAARSGIRDWHAFDRGFPFRVFRMRSFFDPICRGFPPRLRSPLQFAFNLFFVRLPVAFRLRRLLTKQPVDIVCLNTLDRTYWIAPLLARFKDPPRTLFYLHGAELGVSNFTRLYRLSLKRMADADATIAVSSYVARVAASRGIPADKIKVAYSGVDLDRFTPGPKDPGLLAKFNLHGKKVLLCLARFYLPKGQDRLIAAMPEILAAVPDAILLIAGSGLDLPRLLDLTAALQLQNFVLFTGPAVGDEVVQLYRTADVFVMPSRSLEEGDAEGFGLVFLEAGACGRPVIGGCVGGVPEAVLDGETGLLVDGASSTDIAQACIRLLRDPVLAAELDRNGQARARTQGWPARAAHFLALCEAVARGE